jgi:predicted dinucleotide-utilizing enzyme
MESDQKKIGIVGGGKVGLQLLQLFSSSRLTRVLYVVDLAPDAPAIRQARQARIRTFSDIDEAIETTAVDFIFEVTGSRNLTELLAQKLDHGDTTLVTHEMAYILMQVLEENDSRRKQQVIEEVLGIQGSISNSLQGMEGLINNISEITENMRLLSLNARVEAARVGAEGRGFAIVAQQMTQSVDAILKMTTEIEQMNGNIANVSRRIEETIKKLT